MHTSRHTPKVKQEHNFVGPVNAHVGQLQVLVFISCRCQNTKRLPSAFLDIWTELTMLVIQTKHVTYNDTLFDYH